MLAKPKTDYKRKALTLAGGLGGALLVGGLVAAKIAKPRAVIRILKSYNKLSPKTLRTEAAALDVLEDVIRTPQKYLDKIKDIKLSKLGATRGTTEYPWTVTGQNLLYESPARLYLKKNAFGVVAETGHKGNPLIITEKDLPGIQLNPYNLNTSTYTHEMTHASQSATRERGNILDKLDFLRELENSSNRNAARGLQYFDIPIERHAYKTSGIPKYYADLLAEERGIIAPPIKNPTTYKIWYPGYRERFSKALDETLREIVAQRQYESNWSVPQKEYLVDRLRELGLI